MRIIDGDFKKYKINFNKKIKIRPTTDFAKEALFNILENILPGIYMCVLIWANLRGAKMSFFLF